LNYEIEVEALKIWETELQAWGLIN